MTRQGKTWLIIGAVFVALLVARGMIGQGLGRVYVKRTEVIVKLPASSTSAATISWQEWKQVPPLEFDAAQKANPAQTEISFSWPRTIGLWLAAFFTLCLLYTSPSPRDS